MYDNDELLLQQEWKGNEMIDFNIADKAKQMSDAELSASIAAMSAEQQRRAAIPESLRPDPTIAKMLKDRHAELYGGAE